MCIHYDQEHFALKWSCKIDMQALPWVRWVFPYVQRSLYRVVCDTLTSFTSLCHAFDVFIHSGPPDIPSCKSLHLYSPHVSIVQCIQHSDSQFCVNNHPVTPHQDTMMHCQFVLAIEVRCEVRLRFDTFPT